MTKEQFITGYCERSGISWDRLSKSRVAVPCACGDDACNGWAMISNTPELIAIYQERYESQTAKIPTERP